MANETSFNPSKTLGPLVRRLLLEDYKPAAVLVKRKSKILDFLGPTMRHLDKPTGEVVSI